MKLIMCMNFLLLKCTLIILIFEFVCWNCVLKLNAFCILEIIPTRLEALLELTLRTSTANVDHFKDDLRYFFS